MTRKERYYTYKSMGIWSAHFFQVIWGKIWGKMMHLWMIYHDLPELPYKYGKISVSTFVRCFSHVLYFLLSKVDCTLISNNQLEN